MQNLFKCKLLYIYFFSFRDAIIVATGDCLTSIFAGFVIFAIIGYMAKDMGVDISEVATQGNVLNEQI